MTLYRVKFVYSLIIQAPSAEAAHKAICKQIEDAPQSVITAIEDARYTQHRPVWKRLLLGR